MILDEYDTAPNIWGSLNLMSIITLVPGRFIKKKNIFSLCYSPELFHESVDSKGNHMIEL